MSSVVKMLQGEIPLGKPPNPFPFYDSSPESSMFGIHRRLPKFAPAFAESLPEESALEIAEVSAHKESGSNSTLRIPSQRIPVDLKGKSLKLGSSNTSPGGIALLQEERSKDYKVSDSSNLRSLMVDGISKVQELQMNTKPNETGTKSSEGSSSVQRELNENFKKNSVSLKTSSRAEEYEKRCPPGGENSVIVYTTMGGDSRDSYNIRSILQSHQIQMFERNIFFSGYKNELNELMGNTNVPVLFVKGRLIGGVEKVRELDKEGKLGILFDGIPKVLQEQTKTNQIPRDPRSSIANASAQRELSEQLMKDHVSPKPKSSESLLTSLEKRCPPGGGNSVIVYTTSGGNREPFKDSNKVRLLLQSHRIQIFERDIFKDALFREQLKELMGYIKVPLMFVKGRLVGGADKVMEMEENGDLSILFDGIPKVLQGQTMTSQIPRDPRSSIANASPQKELSEQLTRISVSPKPRSSESLLKSLEKRCPPGGENSVIVYTTTGGNREPFKDSNKVRSLLQSHHIQMFERDIFKYALFREQLKELMGYIKVPLMFVNGRLVGGADKVMEMEENGDLSILFDGIPKVLQGQTLTNQIPMWNGSWQATQTYTPIPLWNGSQQATPTYTQVPWNGSWTTQSQQATPTYTQIPWNGSWTTTHTYTYFYEDS